MERVNPTKGLPIKALNEFGSMLTHCHSYCQIFLDLCRSTQGRVLDIGTTYGWVTQQALRTGAQVIANDLDPRHLEALHACEHPRLTILPGRIPGIALDASSLDVVYAAGVLHYLPPEDLCQALSDIHTWLKPGGTFIFVTTSPYMEIYKTFRPIFNDRLRANLPWPGFIPNVSEYIPNLDPSYPPVTLFDQAGLQKLLSTSGFDVHRVEYFNIGKIVAGWSQEGHGMLGSLSQKPV